jgi:hypothetical protein
VLIGVLLAVAIDRLLLMKAQAERAAMEQVLGSMRSGLTIRMAELIAKGRANELATLAGGNPVRMLAQAPDNYLGELFGPRPAALQAGTWYFDTRERALYYLVESAEYFESPLGAPARARFAIRPVFEDVDRDGRFNPGVDSLRGLQLSPLERYHWNLQFIWPDWPWSAPARASGGASG